jgi:bifunctional DNA primase/polymerase-like protein
VTRMVNVALAYAASRPGGMNWPMLPVSPTKGPVCEHGVYSGSTDEHEIRRMWASEPDANPAVRCEAFFVIDIDPRNGGNDAIQRWWNEFGEFPRTWHARTGSGGAHYYFRHHVALDDIPLGRLVDGIDCKGAGRHYVLIPPAVSKSGQYKWITRPSSTPLARAPEWLIREIVELKTPQPWEPVGDIAHIGTSERVERATRYAAAIPPAISGQGGHSATFVAAVRVARGFALTEDEAFHVLTPWNRTCVPPWSPNALRRKIREALRVGTMTMGALLERGRRAA